MAYAVIKTGGKQYRVQQGTRFDVEKLDAEVDSEVKFDALMVGEGESLKVGTPIVDGASVTAKVVNQYRETVEHIQDLKKEQIKQEVEAIRQAQQEGEED